jgi:hypothetical protein
MFQLVRQLRLCIRVVLTHWNKTIWIRQSKIIWHLRQSKIIIYSRDSRVHYIAMWINRLILVPRLSYKAWRAGKNIPTISDIERWRHLYWKVFFVKIAKIKCKTSLLRVFQCHCVFWESYAIQHKSTWNKMSIGD